MLRSVQILENICRPSMDIVLHCYQALHENAKFWKIMNDSHPLLCPRDRIRLD